MNFCNECVLHELQEYYKESTRIDMMKTFHLTSYRNDKVFKTSVSSLEILTLILGIVMFLLLLLLFCQKSAVLQRFRLFMKRRIIRLVVDGISIV